MKITKARIVSKSVIEFDPIFKDEFSIPFVPQAYLQGSGIYKIVNIFTGEIYVGATKNFYRRLMSHKSSIVSGHTKSKKLTEAAKKYGIHNFNFVIIEHTELRNLSEREQFYIDLLKPQYNVAVPGATKSEETIEKIRRSISGIKHPAWRNEIKRIAQTGIKTSPRSEIGKINMSNAQKKLHSSGYKSPRSKAVLQYDQSGNFIREYYSASEAGRHIGVTGDAVTANATGRNRTCQGFVFKYKIQ